MGMLLRPVLAVAVLVTAASPAGADCGQSFLGSTNASPTFNRPEEGGGLSGRMVRYHSQMFNLDAEASCTIYSAQDYDGYILLYRDRFDPEDPLTNVVAQDDDAELGAGTSRIPRDLSQDFLTLAAGNYVLVTTGWRVDSSGSFQNFIQCDGHVRLHQGPSACSFQEYATESQVCLHDRFAVLVDSVTNHPSGLATPVRFGSPDSALFWFYKNTNLEVMVKVLNGCTSNGYWWVFVAGTTNQGHRVLVGDTESGEVKIYERELGPPASAITDTIAFPCP